jgi:predicted unusual protein kinase regulating ubiquinone biosynthesis (AarF/ABC1/UbiB family)
VSEQQNIPKARKTHLFTMAAKIALKQGKKYLQSHPDSKLATFVDQADTLVNHVGRLKGAAMKAVQTLAIEGQDFFPPEVIRVLEKLQSQAPPIASHVLIKQIKTELGDERFAKLKNLSEGPIAAASIGQVYEADYNGQPVVIKVQYPGVAESVDADIDTLKKLLKAFLTVSQKKVEFDSLMEEARRVLKLETDYLHEMKSLLIYKNYFKDTSFIIPHVYEEMTTSKVIVMSKEEGLELTDWIRTNPSIERKKKVARQLLDLYIKEFYDFHIVQTDPNPANFLINEKDEMVILDFGATIQYDVEFVKQFQELVKRIFAQDREALLQQVFDMSFLDRRESQEVQEAFLDFLLLSLEPFKEENQPFNFSNGEYTQNVRNEALRFSRILKYSAPPKPLIFLNRKVGGIFNMIKKMEVRLDISNVRKEILSKDYSS